MSIFGPKNTGKCSQKVARHRLTRQRLTHFSSFDHYENASIFGEGLYLNNDHGEDATHFNYFPYP